MDKIYSWFKNKKGIIYVLRESFPSSSVKNISLKDEDGTKTINLELEDSSHIFISKENLSSKEMCGFNSFEMICNNQSENGDTIHINLGDVGELIFTTSEDIGEDWGEYLFTKRPPKMIPYEKKSENGWPMRLKTDSDDYIPVASVVGNEKIEKIIEKLSINGAANVVMLYRHKKYSLSRSESMEAILLSMGEMNPSSETFVVVPKDEAPSIVFGDNDIVIEVPNQSVCYVKGEEDECFFFTDTYPLMVMKAIFENPESRMRFVETGTFSNGLSYGDENKSFKEKFNKNYFVEQMSNRKGKIVGFFEEEYILNKTKSKVNDFLLDISFLRKTKGDEWLKENYPDLSKLKDLF